MCEDVKLDLDIAGGGGFGDTCEERGMGNVAKRMENIRVTRDTERMELLATKEKVGMVRYQLRT